MPRWFAVLLTAVAFGLTPQAVFAQFEVSGTITTGSGNAVDSDVNDPSAPFAANNDLATSQSIPAPATLGGYLNNPGAGAVGRSQVGGDVADWFTAALPEAFTATLFIAEGDGAVHDLDLFLYEVGNPSTLVDSSMGTETTEQVTAPQTGDYYIVVATDPAATDAATNYILIIGRDPAAAPLFPLSLEHEFAAGQAIIRFTEEAGEGGGGGASLTARAASVGLEPLAGGPGREMLFGLGPAGSGASSKGGTKTELDWLPSDYETREKLETLWTIKRLRRRADVAAADPNYLRWASATPDDELYPSQWHYPLINLPQAWDVTTGSSDTVVAVVDTGALRDHPDLQGVLPTVLGMGYDFVSSVSLSNDGDGIDPDWNDPGNASGSFFPSSFHGSHVAGTVAAATNNQIGVAGVDWNAQIMPVRVLGQNGVGSVFDVQQGVRYAAGLPNDSGDVPSQRADIINLSLGGGGPSVVEQQLYDEVRAAGVIVIAAAGNEDSSAPSYPAAYDGVVSVSAVGPTKRLAPYSNFGDTIDVAAPGGDMRFDLDDDGEWDGVLSTAGQDFLLFPYIYDYLQGTSMASPHMAGVVSLMKARNPDLTPDQLDILLLAGAITDDLGEPGRDDEYGNGLINALKAVQAAAGPMPDEPELVVTPSALNFGLASSILPLSVRNAGGGFLTVTDVTNDSGGWLLVEATDVDAGNLGTYTTVAVRGGLADGAHTATIMFDSTAGPVDVPVVVQVGADFAGDAGFHYIQLIDAATLAEVDEVTAAAANGAYDFTFTDVPNGTYLLGAGSNPDNDASVCGLGEACGGYPLLNELRPITVDQNVSGLDFPTRFGSRLLAIPEPSGTALRVACLLALAVMARRRRS